MRGRGARVLTAHRALLLADLEGDLAALVDDAEIRGISESERRGTPRDRAPDRLARGRRPAGADATRYVERAVAGTPRHPTRPSSPAGTPTWPRSPAGRRRGAPGAPARGRGADPALLDLQGRRLRDRMEELGLTIGGLSRRTGIDTVTLVAILFGQEDMGAAGWVDLSEALGVPRSVDLRGHPLRPGPRSRDARLLPAGARPARVGRGLRHPRPLLRRGRGRSPMRRPGPEESATVVVCSAEEALRESACEDLARRRYLPLPATGADDAARLCRYARAHVLVLDLGLPEGSAFDLLRGRVEEPGLLEDLGVVALLGPGEDPGLLGDDPALAVDDHLRRPFTPEDLRHCLEAVLRRRSGRDDSVTRVGDLLIDSPRRRVTVGDREVHLARKEFLLLRFLASDPTRVFAKDELIRAVWG